MGAHVIVELLCASESDAGGQLAPAIEELPVDEHSVARLDCGLTARTASRAVRLIRTGHTYSLGRATSAKSIREGRPRRISRFVESRRARAVVRQSSIALTSPLMSLASMAN